MNQELGRASFELDEAEEQGGVDIRQVTAVLREHLAVIAACVVGVTLLAVLAVWQMTPIYSATSEVAVETQQTQVVDIEQVMSGLAPDIATMKTQSSFLTSNKLIGKLVDELKLQRDPEFAVRQSRFSLFAPGTWFAAPASAPPQRSALQQMQDRARLVDRVSNAFDVRVTPQSYVLTVTARSRDPRKAALLANTLARLYIDEQVVMKNAAALGANRWLEQRVGELRDAAIAADKAAEMYRAENGLVGESGATIDVQQLTELNSQLIIARTDRSTKAARVSELRRLVTSGEGMDTSSAALDSPLIQRLREQETTVLRKLSELRSTYGPLHPKIRTAQSELTDLRDKIASEIRKIAAAATNDLTAASMRERALSDAVMAARGRTGTAGVSEVRLRELERQAESARAIYANFLNRFNETREQVGLQTPDARIVSQALIPLSPSAPRGKLIVAMAALGSLLLGIALAFLLEWLDNSVRNPKFVEEAGGGTVLTLVPLTDPEGGNPEDVVVNRPASQLAESLRSLHQVLTMVDVDRPTQVLMVTSSLPGEGKTYLSATLSRAAPERYKRVLLIDCDLRRPRVHKAFGMTNDIGLSDVLSGAATLEEALKQDPLTRTQLLLAGSRVPNPVDMLRSQQFAELIRRLRGEFDQIIIDTPPFIPLADARVVAGHVDKLLLCVHWGRTPRPVLANVLRTIRRFGLPLAGAVLGQVDMKRHSAQSYGSYSYYYYRYGNYE